jgi:hypothetical protein
VALEEASGEFRPAKDRRPVIPVPPPVSLVAVEDVRLPATAGLERDLVGFYVGLLQLERDERREGLVLRAENVRLAFDWIEGRVPRDDMRMLGVVVRSLADLMRKLTEAEIEYARERGLVAGEERLLVMDPAGNWLRIGELKIIG